MKKTIFALIIFIFSIFSPVDVQAMDLEKDQQIIEALTSNEFINTLIYYEFEGKKYPIRIIWNPKEEMLWGQKLVEPTSISLIIIANVPIPLARYIEDMVLEIRGTYNDSHLTLKNGEPKNGWNTVEPVYIAEGIKDPINDEIVYNTFHSDNFINKVIYFHIDKEYYQVRLLHNPEGRSFSALRTYNLNGYGQKEYTLNWNCKYAILFDIQAPKDLENHLNDSLRFLSYYDWYFNYTLSNGSFVEFNYTISTGNGTLTTTWTLDTWFDYTASFE